MKKNCLAVLVLIITFRSIVYAGPEDLPWRDVTNGLRESAFYNVAISPGNENTVYVHSATTLYKTDNGGQNWNAVLSLRGTANRINDIVVSDADEAILYAGTGEGLFVSRDGGNSFQLFQLTALTLQLCTLQLQQGSTKVSMAEGTGGRYMKTLFSGKCTVSSQPLKRMDILKNAAAFQMSLLILKILP
jgi:photosystem II stability/assembly factor-like uncharacterized protein